jgi:hypothetical protein
MVMSAVTMEGLAIEVIKPEFLFQLLMSLFANPSGFDRVGLTCADSS